MVTRQPGQIFDDEFEVGINEKGERLPGHTVFCNMCLMRFDTAQNVKTHMQATHNWQGDDVNQKVRPELYVE